MKKIKEGAEMGRIAIDIQVETLNVIDGRSNRLKMVCKELQVVGMDLVLLTEMKVNGCHTHHAY